jgi:hypothetical protein
MSISIDFHANEDFRIDSFSPLNAMALTLGNGPERVTLYNLRPEIAWAMFDLLRTGATRFHYGEEMLGRLDRDPQASADLIRRARKATETSGAPVETMTTDQNEIQF